MVQSVRAELASPFHFFDAIYCINLDRRTDRWEDMQRRFRRLGIERKVRRFSAVETPWNHHIGCALSHRRIVEEARRQQLKTVLVFEDDARFSPDAAEVLACSLRELEGRPWQLLYLGGFRSETFRTIPGCRHLVIPDSITCTHAIAYHHTVYDAILNAVPANATDVALWARTHRAIDQFYTYSLRASSFLTWPIVSTQTSIGRTSVRRLSTVTYRCSNALNDSHQRCGPTPGRPPVQQQYETAWRQAGGRAKRRRAQRSAAQSSGVGYRMRSEFHY
jgi:hypothetical protein